MKRYFDLKVLTALFAITILFAYCKKGDTGATGATGPAGPAGAAGAAGATGPKGDTGTANVMYSSWLNLSFTADSSIGYYTDLTVPGIDTSMLSTGEMKVYINVNTPQEPVILPLPYFDATGSSVQPLFFLQGIELQASFDASTYTDSSGAVYQQYRYILIPGGVLTGKQAHPDWKDYNAVKSFYHIKD